MSAPLKWLAILLILLFMSSLASGKVPELVDLSTFGFWAVVFGCLTTAWYLTAGRISFLLSTITVVCGILAFFIEKIPDNIDDTLKTQAQLAAALEANSWPHVNQIDPSQRPALERFVQRCAVLASGSALGLKTLYDGMLLTPMARSLPTTAGEVVGWFHANMGQTISLDCTCPSRPSRQCR